MRKKIMILGASILQLPAILKAKEMGLEVISVDKDKDAVGFKYSDISLEISTIDIPNIIKAAKKYRIDGIMTLASDMPMQTVAAVCKELNLVGINKETALKTTNKAIMRECLRANGVPIPSFYKVKNYDEYINAISKIDGNVIVKPADNSGSRGVCLIEDLNNKKIIDNIFQNSMRLSHSAEIIIEEYMEGPEVSVETLSLDGDIHIIAITDKITSGAPNFVEIDHSQPTKLPKDIKDQIIAVTKDTVKAVGIINGPSHTEIIVTSDGPKVVEIGARLGGDNITTHLVPYSTGIDMVKCCIDIAMGDKCNLEKKINMGSAIRYFITSPGKITSIEGINEAEKIDGVKEIIFTKNIGDVVDEVTNSSDRIGFVIAQAEDNVSAINICKTALTEININIRE